MGACWSIGDTMLEAAIDLLSYSSLESGGEFDDTVISQVMDRL